MEELETKRIVVKANQFGPDLEDRSEFLGSLLDVIEAMKHEIKLHTLSSNLKYEMYKEPEIEFHVDTTELTHKEIKLILSLFSGYELVLMK